VLKKQASEQLLAGINVKGFTLEKLQLPAPPVPQLGHALHTPAKVAGFIVSHPSKVLIEPCTPTTQQSL
jgi:hypothetical protein